MPLIQDPASRKLFLGVFLVLIGALITLAAITGGWTISFNTDHRAAAEQEVTIAIERMFESPEDDAIAKQAKDAITEYCTGLDNSGRTAKVTLMISRAMVRHMKNNN